jgi:hypothetical protein
VAFILPPGAFSIVVTGSTPDGLTIRREFAVMVRSQFVIEEVIRLV